MIDPLPAAPGRCYAACLPTAPAVPEPFDVLGGELRPQGRAQCVGSEPLEIVVEVAQRRGKPYRLDPDRPCSGDHRCGCAPSGRIIVLGDIEALQSVRQEQGVEVVGRACGDHRHGGQDRTE